MTECGFPHLAGFTTDDAIDELPFVFPRTTPSTPTWAPPAGSPRSSRRRSTSAAIVYGNIPVTERSADQLIEAREAVGWSFAYRQAAGTLESNYTPSPSR